MIEDTMFFPRLRRQAKWVFLFLALAFGLGFVGFGVGAGGVGVGDIFRGAGGNSGVPSVSEAERRVAENPRDAQALRDLATAHQAEANTDEAIEALESFAALRPRNVDALRELAGLYLAQASEAQQRAQDIQIRAAFVAPGAAVAGGLEIAGRPLEPDPITNALSTGFDIELSAAFSEVQQASARAVEMYQRLADASPNDPNVQLELAQAAQAAGDVASAIGAFEAFLELAPDDPTAVEVRRILRQLRAQSGATG